MTDTTKMETVLQEWETEGHRDSQGRLRWDVTSRVSLAAHLTRAGFVSVEDVVDIVGAYATIETVDTHGCMVADIRALTEVSP